MPEAARSLLRRTFVKDFGRLAAGNVTYHVLYLARGIIAARVLGPELMGVWAAGYVLNMYLTNSHLGSLSAMRREMTIARGKGDDAAYEALRNAGFTLGVASALAAATCVLLWVVALGQDMAPTLRWVIALVSLLAVMQQVGLFYSFCLFAEQNFGAVSRTNTLVAVSLIATVPLIWTHGLAGLAAGALCSQVLGLYLLGKKAGSPRRFSRDWALMKRLVREGLPFFGSNIVFTVQNSIDRLVVLGFYGERSLGLYSLALQALSLVNVFVESLSQVSYSRMGVHFGGTDSPGALYSVYRRIPIVLAWAVVPLLVVAALVAEPLVRAILPRYLEAVPALRAICVQGFFMTLTVIPAGFLLTIRRNGVYLANQGLGVVLTWLACVGSAMMDGGLQGVAIATAAATAIYAFFLHLCSAHLGGQRLRDLVADLARLTIPFVLGLAMVITALRAMAAPSAATIVLSVAVMLIAGITAIAFVRRSGLLRVSGITLQPLSATMPNDI